MSEQRPEVARESAAGSIADRSRNRREDPGPGRRSPREDQGRVPGAGGGSAQCVQRGAACCSQLGG